MYKHITLLFLFIFMQITADNFNEKSIECNIAYDMIYESFGKNYTFKEFEISSDIRNRLIPYKVNNSTKPYFRKIFNQFGNSCTIASNIGYILTYEHNYLNSTSADKPENCMSYNYIFNFMNNGHDSFIKRLNALDLVIENGCASSNDFKHNNSYKYWMSGYKKYYRGMKTRVKEYYQITGKDINTVNTMKNYIYDRGNNNPIGGLIAAGGYMGNGVQIEKIPNNSEESGKNIIIKFANKNGGHAMTWVGYNDSIKYDFNGDGEYTNDKDINNDGVVNLQDWEIGAFLVANSWGSNWRDSGFVYVMYRLVAFNEGLQGGMSGWKDIVRVTKHDPKLTIKLDIDYTKRNDLTIIAGISNDTNSDFPSHVKNFKAFEKSGGPFFMQGGDLEEDKNIEIGLDISNLIDSVYSDNFKIFVQIKSDMNGEGKVNTFSVLDYRINPLNPSEYFCKSQNVDIQSNTILSIITDNNTANKSIFANNFEKKDITINHDKNMLEISYELDATDFIQIDLFNAQGKLVNKIIKTNLPIGIHRFKIPLQDRVSNNIYFCRFKRRNEVIIQKIIILN